MFRWVTFGLMVAAGLVLLVAPMTIGLIIADSVVAAIGFVLYACLGGLIIARRDGHPTGWLLVLVGLTVVFANGFANVPGMPAVVGSWVGSWAWGAVFSLFAALTLTFPSGHRPAGRNLWARIGRGALWALPILVAITAFAETPAGPEATTGTVNPAGFIPSWLGYIALFAVIVILLGGAVSLVAKRRGAVGAERAQLTWVVFGLVLLISVVVLTFLYVFVSIGIGAGDPGDGAWIVAFLVMTFFPLSFGVAVLRYRLFEIDRIISRTVTYTVVVGVSAAVFFGVVTALTSLLPAESSDLAVAGSTLAVAALFNPVRRRVQTGVDRRFSRSRYDAQKVMDAFSGSLRDRVDPDGVVEGWVGAVSKTMQPTTVAVWVREAGA